MTVNASPVWSTDRRVGQRRHLPWRRRGVDRRQASAYALPERRRKLADRRSGTDRREL